MDYTLLPMTEPKNRRPVVDIFNYFIEHTFAAFPDEPVDYAFYDRLLAMSRGYPALVAKDTPGQVVGFAFLRPYHLAASFQRCAEITYFIMPEHTRRGIGTAMLAEIVRQAPGLGIDSILAAVSSRNEPSINFHLKHSFEERGRLLRVGRKLGQDFDVVWMQKRLA